MNQNRAPLVLVAAVATAGLLAACLGPKKDPTQYYVLASLLDDADLLVPAGLEGGAGGEAAHSAGPAADARIGVGPIALPAYLKRSRMVTRLADNQLQVMETARWAEPLEGAFQSTLALDISSQLGADVILHPWYATETPTYSVSVEVFRFERDEKGTAHLSARWELRDSFGEVIATDSFLTSEEPKGEAVAGSVSAQSRAVAALSRQVADAIRRAAS
jgi:uncharacterized lipoprotein YmbA